MIICYFYSNLVHHTEKAMAIHSSTLAQKIPWVEEPGRVQSMGSLSRTQLSNFIFTRWRKKWKPTPVFLPGESQGQENLVGCRLWGRTESDTTEATQQQQQSITSYSVQTLKSESLFNSTPEYPHLIFLRFRGIQVVTGVFQVLVSILILFNLELGSVMVHFCKKGNYPL